MLLISVTSGLLLSTVFEMLILTTTMTLIAPINSQFFDKFEKRVDLFGANIRKHRAIVNSCGSFIEEQWLRGTSGIIVSKQTQVTR